MRRRICYALAASLLITGFAVPRKAHAGDPTTADCLAASETSLVLRNQHRLREARAQLLICSAATCPADVRGECIRRVEMVNVSMPTVVFEAKDTAGNDLSAVRVTMDGQPLVERLEGTALSIDPGEHVFVFEKDGQPPVQRQMVILENEKGRRERIVFSTRTPEVVVARPIFQPAPPPTRTPGGFGTQRILAIASAGVGVIGFGLGIGFGLEALSKHDDAQKVCPDRCADQKGVDLWSEAVTAGDISTAAFIVGSAALIGGAVLWFTAPTASRDSGAQPSTQLGFGPGTMQVRGSW